MMIDLNFEGKYVVIVGGGSEGYRKALKFLKDGSKILVVSKSFSENIQKLSQKDKVDLLKLDIEDGEKFMHTLNPKPDLLLATTNDRDINFQLVKHAKSAGCIVYAVDNPSISDFMFPATAKVGDIRIAISTKGQSPAMAKVLRQRIEKTVTPEDLLQIRLQKHIRKKMKQQIPNQESRRQVLYQILEDTHIKRLLKEGKLDKAQRVALKISENFSVNTHTSQEI